MVFSLFAHMCNRVTCRDLDSYNERAPKEVNFQIFGIVFGIVHWVGLGG